MDHFVMLSILLLALVSSYEIINDASTAYASCQDVLNKDPTAEDGLYFVNNYGEVSDPYLTFCMMSVNRGGWTLFYKNSNLSPEGESYSDLFVGAQSFLSAVEDITDPSVVGVSPVAGLRPVSLMAVPIDAIGSVFSAVYFDNVDVAQSIVEMEDLVPGCNEYSSEFRLVETWGKEDFVFTGFNFNNGTFNFRSCEDPASGEAENPANVWLGDIYANDTRRLVSCGGLPSNHCLYFLREQVQYDPVGDCMCRASGVDGMVWPATKCGEERTIACFEGADNGMISRRCGADAQWEAFIQGNCTCTGETEFETAWPTTKAGETAHVVCANDSTKSRDRLCLPNGKWDNVMTGGCSCSAEEYRGVQWEETEGGAMGEHVCNIDSEGSAYRRPCNVDGTWGDMTGGCTCATVSASGVVWEATTPMQTQVVQCAAGSVGETMSRTCGRYGSWYPIEGNCDCGEEEAQGMVWPQTTSGTLASVSCVAGAVGTPSTRRCNALGTWGEVTEGHCACPAADWANYAGTHYLFPQTDAGAVAMLPCANGEGSITRACQQYGQWSAPEGCYEPVYCPAEDVGELHFERTLGGTTAMSMCHTSSMSYGRLCKENGEWESVVGYCLCPAEKDAFNTEWPATRSGAQVTMPCGEGFSGEQTRDCAFFGDWVGVSGDCSRNRCAAEESVGTAWPETDSLTTVEVECASGLGAGFSRACGAEGVWGSVEGACACPAQTIDGVEYPQAPSGTVVHKECPAGFTGSLDRLCSGKGEWEAMQDNCVRITCPEETFKGALWPATNGGEVATYSCPDGEGEGLSRRCGEDGVWSLQTTGSGCHCPATVVEERGTYVFARTEPGVTVEKACDTLYYGTIRSECSLGGTWTNTVNECQRYQCPENWVDEIRFPKTDSNTTRVVECAASAVGSGYLRFCSEEGVWDEAVEGECRCPAEEVHHTDGLTYAFEETAAGTAVSQTCGPNMRGTVARSCSRFGQWGALRSTCTRLQCPEEMMDGYLWPATNSSETAYHRCNDYQAGYVSRLCQANGVWEDPKDTCSDETCRGVTINRLDNGCMNLKFDLDPSTPYVRLNVVPSSSPDLSIVFRGRTVRVCGLEVNVAYSLFVHYCADESSQACPASCKITDVYYQQSCDTMRPVDIVEYRPAEESAVLTFSAKFPSCPLDPDSLEIVYQCVDNCEGDTEEHKVVTKCTSLNGCVAGERRDVEVDDAFPPNAVFVVRQRMQLVAEFAELQPFSPDRQFRPRDLTRASAITPSVRFINSQTLRLDLGAVDSGVVLYKKHVLYIYKKQSDSRRLVDSLFSKVVLCPLANGICEETGTTVVVEPGYRYTFSVYSYPVVSLGKVIVSTDTVDVDPLPVFSVVAEPGDDFIQLTFAGAKYPLSGLCVLYARSAGSEARSEVDVALPADTEVKVIARNLVTDSLYTVVCTLRDTLGLQNSVTIDTRTLPITPPQLTLAYVRDTTYDVRVSATVNKFGYLYCMVTDLMKLPSVEEVVMSGVVNDIPAVDAPFSVDLVLGREYSSEYRVTCAALDNFLRSDVKSLIVTPSGQAYEPELVSTTPAMDATDVPPYVEMQLTFRYPVRVNDCQFCFFILYNSKDHTSVSIYAPGFTTQGNTITFATRRLESLTTYQLKPSTRQLIIDSATGVAYEPASDVLISFTTKEYNPTSGEVVYPTSSRFPVNGVIEVAFTNYLYINAGSISLNALAIDAANTCLQLKHPTRFTTSLFIHVASCVGNLFPDTEYTLIIPQGFLQTRDLIQSPRLEHPFLTEDASFAPRVIDATPAFQTVPVDTPITLMFDQPVVFGDGYLFVSEYIEDHYVNAFNIPASKASFSSVFPFSVTWDASLFSFQRERRYVVSWSEDMVRNAQGQSVAASAPEDNVEFETGSSACSPDFIAEGISGTLACTTTGDKCVCRTSNVLAVDY